jgi:DNA mismatch repair ATPase MutS
MKALLMYRDRDFDPKQSLRHFVTYGDQNIDPRQQLSPHELALIQDMELDTLWHAMSGNDEFLFEVAERAVLTGMGNDMKTIFYRQEILKDCLLNTAAVKQIYDLAVEAIEGTKRRWWDLPSHYTGSVLYSALELLETSVDVLRRLRDVAVQQAGRFESEGFTRLFATLRNELNEEYLATVENYLGELKFRKGVLLSAELGEWNESTSLLLRKQSDKKQNWLERIFGKSSSIYTFYLAERDEHGAQILSDIRNRGISGVVVVLAQSADHVVSFFKMLRAELAFYCGCLNLHGLLTGKGEPVCCPTPLPAGERAHCFRGLYDVCLSLRMAPGTVGNSLCADGKGLVVITGANQGGKSTFLRSIGLAQLMMQCGMFVGAEDFSANLCSALFTHYKREEDTTMEKGKLDEELARMSHIADNLEPNSMLLFNESFAATNEREGSEIARQIVSALLEKCSKIFCVTHLYQFAHSMFEKNMEDAIFLRAERTADGTRTFKLIEGEPLDTSYGADLYRQVFGLQETVQDREPHDVTAAVER